MLLSGVRYFDQDPSTNFGALHPFLGPGTRNSETIAIGDALSTRDEPLQL